MNLCLFSGNLVADPEMKYVGDNKTAVVNFCIAVNRNYRDGSGKWQKEVAFLEMEAWDSAAENICRNWRKGDGIVIADASVKQRTFENAEGKKVRLTYWRVNRFEPPLKKGWYGENASEEDAEETQEATV